MIMKKVLFTLALILTTISSYAEQIIGKYQALGKEWDVEAVIKNNNISIFIQVMGEYESDKVYINLGNNKDIELFRAALLKAEEKYVEWCAVAKENGVTDYSKKLDITFPSCEIFWRGRDQWRSTFRKNHLFPFIFIIKDKDISMGTFGTAEDWENEFITQKWYFILGSEYDFNSLYEITDLDYIRKELNKHSNTDDLFQ